MEAVSGKESVVASEEESEVAWEVAWVKESVEGSILPPSRRHSPRRSLSELVVCNCTVHEEPAAIQTEEGGLDEVVVVAVDSAENEDVVWGCSMEVVDDLEYSLAPAQIDLVRQAFAILHKVYRSGHQSHYPRRLHPHFP